MPDVLGKVNNPLGEGKKILASEIWQDVFLGEAQNQIAAKAERKSFTYP